MKQDDIPKPNKQLKENFVPDYDHLFDEDGDKKVKKKGGFFKKILKI